MTTDMKLGAADAEHAAREALASNPSSFKDLIRLSVLLRNRGGFAESAALAQQAVDLRSDAMEGHLQLGLCLLASARFEEAATCFANAIRLRPTLAPLHHNLGLALENLGRTEESIEAFRSAVRLAPEDNRSRLSLGAFLLSQDRVEEARQYAQSALRIEPNSAAAHVLVAKVLVALRKDDEAETYMRKAVDLDPTSALAHSMWGFRLMQKGEFSDSEASFRRSLECDPMQGLGYFGITQCRRLSSEDEELIRAMNDARAAGPMNREEASYLSYALAKAHDNLGDYEGAMVHYHEAHRQARGEQTFDREEYARDIDRRIRLYSADRMQEPQAGAFESDLPIFVVGMMRSGTTLVEQILSSHPSVGGGGEQWFWPLREQQAEEPVTDGFNSRQASVLAREYCRSLRQAAPGYKRVTDKLPGNYLRLGLLHLALPNARILHMRRDPIDTCLSIYFTPNPTAPPFAHRPEDIVFAYREYRRLTDHWRTVLPVDRLMEVEYESLVSDPEPVIRKIVEFCGLEWDDACLHHERNAKVVKTPSLWQVRQGMYSSSVGRWKRYEPWLGAFLELADLL